MREHTKQPYKICTSLVGRHSSSSLVMYTFWVVVMVFNNFLSFMIELKYNKYYHVHIKEAIQGIRVTNFSRTMDSCLIKSVETFVMVSISDMPIIKYQQNL